MSLRHVRQENESSGCGPACVAIIADVSYRRAREAMFGDRIRALRSYYPDLREALLKLDAKAIAMPVRATRFDQADQVSIFGVKRTHDGKRWHWVVYDPFTARLYDPMLPKPLPFTESLNVRYRPFSRQAVQPRVR
jgi:hypothetical protein